MKILFLTISRIDKITKRHIYTDLIRKFASEGHDIYIITPLERRFHQTPKVIINGGVTIIQVKTLNFQKTNYIEKGLSSFFVEYQFYVALRKHLSKIQFDLVLYSTPPITFTRIVSHIKKRYNALSYLLLKDIFPQNAVDLGIIKRGSVLHKFYMRQERALYLVSDYIGCMSPANVDFIRRNNSELDAVKVEINPNSIEIIEHSHVPEQKEKIREKYGIPLKSLVYIYGGNLGRPQGLNFLLECLEGMSDKSDLTFVIVGSGTELSKVQHWFEINRPSNAFLIPQLSQTEYDQLIQSCDVGMIFLDRRFTIPNFPSRLLPYLENKMPVIAATDVNTDIGTIIEDHNMGLWSVAGDVNRFRQNVNELARSSELRERMGNNGFRYLKKYHNISISYKTIMNHFV